MHPRIAVAATILLGLTTAFAPALTLPLGPAAAQSNVLRIAAVVNDEIISVLDLEQRLRLVALSSNLQVNQQTRQRLLPQILRSMIDERLQFQEAKRNGVTATDQEIDREITNLAERNNIPPVQFEGFLAREGIDISALRYQLEAQMSWAKYAGRRLSREVEVGEEEIDEELRRLEAVADLPQKRVYEIFLGIDNPDRVSEVSANAQRLLTQIRNGADFSNLARSFSESGTANQGGDLGWIAPGQLPEELDQALSELSPGEVSSPIRGLTGFYLLYVTDLQKLGRDPDAVKISLIQLTQRLPQENRDAARQSTVREFEAARSGLAGCDDLKRLGEARDGASIAAASDVSVGDLPGPVQEAVNAVPAGGITQPIDMGSAVVLVGVCTRDDPGLSLPGRDQIQERLGNQKLDLLIRRKMRDLRREAFIDIRL